MPMPKLLKRFSEKNLVKRSRSASEEPSQISRPGTSDGKDQNVIGGGPNRSLSYPLPNHIPPLPPKDGFSNGFQSFRSESPAPESEISIPPREVANEQTSTSRKDSQSKPLPAVAVAPASPMATDSSDPAAKPSADNDSLLKETWSVLKDAPSEGESSILGKIGQLKVH